MTGVSLWFSIATSELVQQGLLLAQVVVLSVALAFSAIAARGCTGTEWESVLDPLPVVVLALLLLTIKNVLPLPESMVAILGLVFLGGIVIGTTILSVELVRTLDDREVT